MIDRIASSKALGPAAGSLILLFLFAKLWLRFGYRFVSDDRRRVRLAYAAFASELMDLGIQRRAGETRQEFRDRIARSMMINAGAITSMHEHATYRKGAPGAAKADVGNAVAEWKRSYDQRALRIAKRVVAFFNPKSLLRWWSW